MTHLPLSRLLLLALRQTWRDVRAGELQVLFFALLVAVTASSAIGYFSERLSGAMQTRATEFLGADLVLTGSEPARPEQIEDGRARGLQHARVVEFSSVIAGEQSIELSSVKAVDSAYPLRGELRSAEQPHGAEQPGHGPAPGEAWGEARLFAALALSSGDVIDVGRRSLRLSRVLTHEPDRSGDFYSLTPRVLMHIDDLAATGVVQPGSRVRYRDLWSGEPKVLQNYRQAQQASLRVDQKFEDVRDGNSQVGRALDRAERYLNLASLAAVMLSGVAVALSASRFAVRRYDASALLRCLGLSRRQALLLFSLQLALIGLLACCLGALLGWLGQLGLLHLLRELLPPQLPASTLMPGLAGIAIGLVALAGFAPPPLAALGRVPPLRVLRRDMLPMPASTWVSYGVALLALGLIMWRLSLDLSLTLALLGGGSLAALLLGGLLLLGLRGLRRLLNNAGLIWRLGVGQLLRHPLAAAGQILAFGLILLAMALIALLRGELLDTWQAQLPEQAPNHFALNIMPAEREAFAERLASLASETPQLYPVVPGRLVRINGEPVRQTVSKDEPGDNALRRDLSLTWAAALPPENELLAGSWWQEQSEDMPGVSVESQLAERLKLHVGDRLTFNIGGDERETRITSLRSVQWDNFKPNFYMVFQPGTLSGLPVTYLTSFHLAAERETELVGLSREYPGVTLMQIESILRQLREILAQVTLAVEYVLVFVLAAGFCVLFAGLQATLDERIRQGALLRALGARRQLLIRARRAEFALLGAASGLLAALGCELISWLLYRFAFDLAWQPHPWLLLLPLLGASLIALAGTLGTRRALSASPLTILRQT
jgi:putative ABC transport system permease protein